MGSSPRRHSRGPDTEQTWIPACAGMTRGILLGISELGSHTSQHFRIRVIRARKDSASRSHPPRVTAWPAQGKSSEAIAGGALSFPPLEVVPTGMGGPFARAGLVSRVVTPFQARSGSPPPGAATGRRVEKVRRPCRDEAGPGMGSSSSDFQEQDRVLPAGRGRIGLRSGV